MGMIKPQNGDIVHINMGLAYPGCTNEYDAVVLWDGFNKQPLLTRIGEYRPFWASYDEIERITGHVDLEGAVSGKAIPVEWLMDLANRGDFVYGAVVRWQMKQEAR